MARLNLTRFAALAGLVATAATCSAATIYVLSDNNRISSFNSFAPQGITDYGYIAPPNGSDTLVALDCIPTSRYLYGVAGSGQFYGIGFLQADFYSPPQLVAQSVGSADSGPLTGSNFGLGLFPVVRDGYFPMDARLVSDADEHITFDRITGEATTQSAINPASHMAAITYADTPLPEHRKTYGLDYESNMLVTIDPDTGTVSNVGPVGLDFDNNVAMDYSDGTLFAILRVQGTSGLYILNSDTGAVQYSLGPLKDNIVVKDMGTLAAFDDTLAISKAAIKLNFAKPDSDAISLSGNITVPDGWQPAGESFTVNVGGVVQTFVLDSKLKAQSGSSKVSLKLKLADGVTYAQTGKIQLKLAKGNFSAALADDGLTNADIQKEPRSIDVEFSYMGQKQKSLINVLYSAKAGKSGKAK